MRISTISSILLPSDEIDIAAMIATVMASTIVMPKPAKSLVLIFIFFNILPPPKGFYCECYLLASSPGLML
jgi:hypothetical protein